MNEIKKMSLFTKCRVFELHYTLNLDEFMDFYEDIW